MRREEKIQDIGKFKDIMNIKIKFDLLNLCSSDSNLDKCIFAKLSKLRFLSLDLAKLQSNFKFK